MRLAENFVIGMIVSMAISGCDLSQYVLGDRSDSGPDECNEADSPNRPNTPTICEDPDPNGEGEQ